MKPSFPRVVSRVTFERVHGGTDRLVVSARGVRAGVLILPEGDAAEVIPRLTGLDYAYVRDRIAEHLFTEGAASELVFEVGLP